MPIAQGFPGKPQATHSSQPALAANPSALASGRIIQPPQPGDSLAKDVTASQSQAKTVSVVDKGAGKAQLPGDALARTSPNAE